MDQSHQSASQFPPQPSQPNQMQQNTPLAPQKPKLNKKILIVVVLLFLISVIAVFGYYLNSSLQKKTMFTNLNANLQHKSIMDYLPDMVKVKSGHFKLKEGFVDVFNQSAPNATGTFSRSDNGFTYTVFDVDQKLVKEQVDAFKKRLFSNKNINKEFMRDFYLGNEYQLDMLTFLGLLGMLPNFDEANSQYRKLHHANNKQCLDGYEDYKKKVSTYLNNLTPQYTTKNGKQRWVLNYNKEIDQTYLFYICDKRYRGDSDWAFVHNQMTFEVVKSKDTILLEVFFNRDVSVEDENNVMTDKVLTLELYDFNTDVGNISVKNNPTSAFSLDSRYLLKLNECKALPITATTAAGGRSYTPPASKTYYGPSFFETAFFCTENQAKDTGYSNRSFY